MIDASVNVGGVLRAFDRMKRTDLRRSFSEARKPVRVDQRAHARASQGSSGRWPGLAASTIERRSRGRKRRRKLLGRLPGALKITSDATKVRAESRARFSRVHQSGGRAGHGAKIPAREFLWISRELARSVRDILKAAYLRAWAGR